MSVSTTYRKSGATAVYPVVGGITLKSTTDIDDGWYHIAVTLKRGGTSYMYINGTEEDSVPIHDYHYQQYGQTYWGASYPLDDSQELGEILSEDRGIYVITPKCHIDDICSWTTALSSDNIVSIYNNGSPNDLREADSYHTEKISDLINYYIMEIVGAGGVYIIDRTYGLGEAGSERRVSAVLLFSHGSHFSWQDDEVPGDSSFSTKSLVFDGESQDTVHLDGTSNQFFVWTMDKKPIFGMDKIGAYQGDIVGYGVDTDFSLSFWFKWDDGHPGTFPTVNGAITQNYLMASGNPRKTNYDNMVLKFNSSDKKIEFIFNEYQRE